MTRFSVLWVFTALFLDVFLVPRSTGSFCFLKIRLLFLPSPFDLLNLQLVLFQLLSLALPGPAYHSGFVFVCLCVSQLKKRRENAFWDAAPEGMGFNVVKNYVQCSAMTRVISLDSPSAAQKFPSLESSCLLYLLLLSLGTSYLCHIE